MELERSVYLANNFGAQAEMRALRQRLGDLGVKVTSRWIDIGEHDEIRKDKRLCCWQDLIDIEVADALVYFADNHNGNPGLGKHIEFGYALALKKPIFLIRSEGTRDSVFYHHQLVTACPSLDAYVASIAYEKLDDQLSSVLEDHEG